MIDLVYVTHNRREYTEASLDALLANTNWALVDHLYLMDDNSTDGTYQHLDRTLPTIDCSATLRQSRFGGPVAAMNAALDTSRADMIAKVDSDVIVCPGWLDEMLYVLDNSRSIDALGMEPGFGAPVQSWVLPDPHKTRGVVDARWIGGVFLARSRAFRTRPVQTDRFFGLTSHWRKFTTAWITPDLPSFLLDHIDLEPWKTLARVYIEKGWMRPWTEYFVAPRSYYDWWLTTESARKMETAAR